MDHQITLTEAAEMTALFRANKQTVIASGYQDSNILANCETFDKEAVVALLNQRSAAFLRIYYGMDESLRVHAILVAADNNNADISPSENIESEGTILEDAQRCPPFCPPASALNDD